MITSTANSQVKELVRLRKKSRYREEKGLFLAEGLRLVREIAPAQIERVYVSESFARKAGLAADARAGKILNAAAGEARKDRTTGGERTAKAADARGGKTADGEREAKATGVRGNRTVSGEYEEKVIGACGSVTAAGVRGNRTASGECEAATAAARENTEEFEKVLRSAEVLSDTVFAYAADTKTPQGILAVVRRMEYTFSDILRPRGTCDRGNAQTSGQKNKNAGRDRKNPDSGNKNIYERVAASEQENRNGCGCAPAAEAGSDPTGVRETQARNDQVKVQEIRTGNDQAKVQEVQAAPLLVILENLQDPGNLGTIFRTAEAAGATGILMNRDCADVYSPKVIRSAMGSAFRLPFVCTDDLSEAIARVRAAGVRVYAAHLEASSVYDEEDYCAGTAFLIGNEGNGLTDEAAACADVRIHIPMAGEAESLNAAAAGAVLLYEASRQRRRTSI